MPNDRPNVQKARIIREDDPSKEVVCHFNPEEFSITRKIKWQDSPSQGNNAPQKVFAGGEADDLTIDLWFDTTDTADKDVRDTYAALIEMAEIDQNKKNAKTGKGEPPKCKFIWGNFLSFTAVIQKITQKFVMFRADGTPVRAKVTVTFEQLSEEKPKRQNPTSQSESRKIWVVHEGQTLDWIAYQEYGDPACWRYIAETNNLMDPKELRPGQILKLVPLP
ncbi:MAG: peptidoglycan-binding protein [Chloroflexi bacterium]|nr:peptidoglycan-binding protein [Chloroflexota bacterium]